MQTFLLWRLGEDPRSHDAEVERARARLHAYCGVMFNRRLESVVRRQAGYALLYVEMPVVGWTPPQQVASGGRWALALDYPVDADRAFSQEDGDESVPYLLRFASALRRDPAAALKRVSPPFVLISGADGGDCIEVQNDALGFCQLLEHSSGSRHALTNRPLALRALGIELEPEPVDWAARALTGWFPLDRTGFRGVRYVGPATRLALTAHGVERQSLPVLRDLIAPAGLSPEEACELAAASIRDHALAASRFWTRAVVAFSGGRDSRALVAAMIAANVPFDHLRTHGRESNREMIIARHLAKVAKLPHVAQTERGFPPATPEILQRSLTTAARFQLGLMETKAHKIYCMKDPRLGAGKVNVMGKHGELGRGYYYGRVKKAPGGMSRWKAALLHYLTAHDAGLLQDDVRASAIELVAESVEAAVRHGLAKHSALDFHYLHERTRRWASGTIYNQPNKVVTPYLNPRYIRAVFHLPVAAKKEYEVQRRIVESAMPVWKDVPYLQERSAKRWCKRRVPAWQRWGWVAEAWLERTRARGRAAYLVVDGKRYGFDNHAYWRSVGSGLIEDALAHSDLVNRVFDRRRLAERWPKEPDLLAVTATVERVSRESLDPA